MVEGERSLRFVSHLQADHIFISPVSFAYFGVRLSGLLCCSCSRRRGNRSADKQGEAMGRIGVGQLKRAVGIMRRQLSRQLSLIVECAPRLLHR